MQLKGRKILRPPDIKGYHNGMKRLFLIIAAAFVFAGLYAPTRTSAAGVNDFVIQDYQIEYYLGKDKDGHSTLKTVESITALFPQIDQNHGIERAIPITYDGHGTNIHLSSITDATGRALQYQTRGENNNTILRIGDANTYVHGPQVYKITYTQRDVTKFFQNTNDDEFYWDTNGTGWAVPIQSLSARFHITDDSLRSALTGKQACYQGKAGSTATCTLAPASDGFTASATQLAPYENMTVAIGFKPHTFQQYQRSLGEKLAVLWGIVQIVTSMAAFILCIYIFVQYYKRSNRTAEMRTIIPEYLPPPDTSVATSSQIARKSNLAFSAQLIDFAVRHYIKIYQTREKRWFRQANYELEIVKDISTLKDEEQEVFRDIFDDPVVGARLDMATLHNNSTVARKLMDNSSKLALHMTGAYGLRARDSVQTAWFRRLGKWTLVAALLTLSPALLVAGGIAFICSLTLHPFTDKGLALARYLKGLELYIKVAESERLKMLQSPEGAAKLPAPIDTNDTRQLIKLYERVLPYAILMGQETEWNKRLGQYYERVNESPTWMGGNNAAFSAVAFGSFMNSLNTVATYSDPSSSSSGGSGGGGSSGGGGGGGGGGGW